MKRAEWLKIKPYLLVLPAVGAIILLFFGGIFLGMQQSLGYFPAVGQYDLSLKAYQDLLEREDFWKSLMLTMRISLLSTILSGLLGLLIAIALYFLGTAGNFPVRLLQRFILSPILIPHLAAAYMISLLLMQSGWLPRIGFALGWIEEMSEFPVMVHDPEGWGIILAYVWKETPFIALMLYPVLHRIHQSWLEAARVLGANSWHFMKEILFPLLTPTLLLSCFIVFAFTFSAFEIPFLLGVTYPEMISVYAYNLYTSGGLRERPHALAVNILLTAITVLLGYAAYRTSRRWSIREGRGWH